MVAIKFNGVRKIPGRPTLVEGIEGRRYVNDKILKALEASQKTAGGYKSYSTYSPFEDYSNWEEGLDESGSQSAVHLSEENVSIPQFETDAEDENTSEFEQISDSGPFQEGFEIGPALRACIEETYSYPCVTENQIRCQQATADTDEADHDEYFDYPESGMFNANPDSSEEACEQPATRKNRSRTSILRVPSRGVVRSCRGTVELLVHADGRTFKPIYNKCGILIGVDCSDGYTLVKNRCSGDWNLFGPTGATVNEDAIIYVAFDKQGNLSYQCESGRLVTLYVDGKIVTSA